MITVDGIKSGKNQVSAEIRVGSRRHELVFSSVSELSENAADALLLLALPAAMSRGGPLIINDPVSRQLLERVPAIQKYYNDWKPKLKPVEVLASPRETAGRNRRSPPLRKASAFTAGVDSFYAALQEPDVSLVYIHGLDVPLENYELRKTVEQKLRWAAAGLDRELLVMETNLRAFSDRYLDWNLAFGGALAACALLLSRHLDVFGIPAGQSGANLRPGGSHPLFTSLLSTEDVAVQTRGVETDRVDKVEAIADNSVVQGALRVCWENRGNAYNCGICEKCQRTMAALDIFGVLDKYTVFSLPLDYGRLSRAVAPNASLERFTRENLRKARARNANPELIRSLERSLNPGRAWFYRFLHYRIPRRFYDGYYRLFRRKT